MSVTINIPEKIYKSLEHQAQKLELESVEQLLEELTEQFEEVESVEREDKLAKRHQIVDGIAAFRKRMKEKYGVMPDSTEILREDRMRG